MGCFCKRGKKGYDDSRKIDFDSSLKEEEKSKIYSKKNEKFGKIKGFSTDSDNKEEEEKAKMEKTFIELCNDFINQIKINTGNRKIEILNKPYILYEDDDVKIQVVGRLEERINNITNDIRQKIRNLEKPAYETIFVFEKSNIVNDNDLEKGISSISSLFKKNGIDLIEKYPLFKKKIGDFIIDGSLRMRYTINKISFELVLELKKEQTEKTSSDNKYLGILGLEIIFKEKTIFINFTDKSHKKENYAFLIIFSIIMLLILFFYEDKIELVKEIPEKLDKNCKNEKKTETGSLLDQFIKSEQFTQSSYS